MINQNDYENFLESKDKKTPPIELDKKILTFVSNELNPSHKEVFLKLLSIQFFIGVITMTFCPQFSLSLTNSYELFHFFHHTYGESICMFLCGSIFIGSGALVASYTLGRSEIRTIQKSRFLYNLTVVGIFLILFNLVGVQTYLDLMGFWFLGAFIGGIFLFEINFIFRKFALKY